MEKLYRGTIALMLVGLFVVLASGSAFAHVSPAPQQGQPSSQAAQEAMLTWENAHPLEYYLALPVDAYVSQAQVTYWDNAHPLEYYLALPITPEEKSVQLTYWDTAHPLEYYLALPGGVQLVQNEDSETDALAAEYEAPCGSC